MRGFILSLCLLVMFAGSAFAVHGHPTHGYGYGHGHGYEHGGNRYGQRPHCGGGGHYSPYPPQPYYGQYPYYYQQPPQGGGFDYYNGQWSYHYGW
jgi:hypothetical protein